MAPLPDAPGIVRVSLRGTNSGLIWANVMHVAYSTGTPDSTALDTFSADIAAAYHTNLMTHLENELLLTEVVSTDLTTTSSPQGSWSGSFAGGYSGQPFPAQVAVCVSWKQALRYRGGHPRTYLAAIPLAAGADNHSLTPTYVGYYLAGAQAFRTAVNSILLGALDVQLGALSYYSKVETPAPPHLRPTPLFLPFSDAAVHSRLDTQRRRLGREAA